jgi:hypothetical protein
VHAPLQGNLAANCWLLSAIACLTEFQDALPVLFPDRGRALQEVTKARPLRRVQQPCARRAPPRCAHAARAQVRIFDKATEKWRVVQVDDRIPCSTRNNKCAQRPSRCARPAPGLRADAQRRAGCCARSWCGGATAPARRGCRC